MVVVWGGGSGWSLGIGGGWAWRVGRVVGVVVGGVERILSHLHGDGWRVHVGWVVWWLVCVAFNFVLGGTGVLSFWRTITLLLVFISLPLPIASLVAASLPIPLALLVSRLIFRSLWRFLQLLTSALA